MDSFINQAVKQVVHHKTRQIDKYGLGQLAISKIVGSGKMNPSRGNPSNPGYPPQNAYQQAYPPAPGGSPYPPQPGYPSQGPAYPLNPAYIQNPSPQLGYPPSQPGYPSAQPGYPPAQAAYPQSQPGYPSAQPGYPSAQPGYPSAQPGYPPVQPGYPSAQPGYPSAQPGYPPVQPGYPQPQSAYPPAQPNPYGSANRANTPQASPFGGNPSGYPPVSGSSAYSPYPPSASAQAGAGSGYAAASAAYPPAALGSQSYQSRSSAPPADYGQDLHYNDDRDVPPPQNWKVIGFDADPKDMRM